MLNVPTVLDTKALLMRKGHSASGQAIFILRTTLCFKAMAGKFNLPVWSSHTFKIFLNKFPVVVAQGTIHGATLAPGLRVFLLDCQKGVCQAIAALRLRIWWSDSFCDVPTSLILAYLILSSLFGLWGPSSAHPFSDCCPSGLS